MIGPKHIIGIGLLFLLVIVYYMFAGSQIGIGVSCESNEILEIERVPGQLMVVAPPVVCQVELKAEVANVLICSDKIKLITEKYVFPCNEIKDHTNESISVSATFYDADGIQEIGKDSKLLSYNPE